MTLYADDPDARVEYQVTDSSGGTNDWASPRVWATSSAGVTVEIDAAWQGAAGATRRLRVPVAQLEVGRYRLRLVVPDGNDVDLDAIELR